MELTPYLSELREQLVLAAEAGDAPTAAAAERLAVALEPAARLALLGALSEAAAEITAEIAPGSVDVRLRGRDPEIVVQPAPAPAEPAADLDPWAGAADDAAMTRINLRLPQDLKERVEEAARAAGLSVNAWLVRSAAASLARSSAAPTLSRPAPTRGQTYSGWVR